MTRRDFNELLTRIQTLSPVRRQRLRQQLDRPLAPPRPGPPARGAQHGKAAAPGTKARTVDEFHRQLLAAGRLASVPDPALDIDDDDPDDVPVPIPGEPLSETILRARR